MSLPTPSPQCTDNEDGLRLDQNRARRVWQRRAAADLAQAAAIKLINDLDIPAADKDKIFWSNARRLLKLN